ncbi:spermatogenesis-associated protein 7 isoform X2 [Manis pentadactyla]|uniref:spermatogenesis-associated protein 7 isoform X2 n=1 Tax=Manis pentadactyla TaxID=143292 RepID=UPI00255C3537|nr:spermatogenesis-associated protein 7 isoform X2 [Manis pentadactyla]
MDGSRRVRATSVLPKYGPRCLFKGHLSTKSNAAVDCSVPLSMSTSIKYADQQRREKLKKELAQCEKELKLNKTAVPSNSKNNPKSLLHTLQKPSGEPQHEDGMLIEEANGFLSFTRSPVTSSERLHLSLPNSKKVLPNGTEKNSSSSLSNVNHTASRPRKLCSRASFSRRPRSPLPNSHRFQLVISKAPSGDLLDKHSELFSNRHLPFTPRTLKTEAKSFLSQYRYYTPAKKKKDISDQRIEAETQTELSSFKSDFEAVETKNFTDSDVNIKQASNCVTYGTEGKIIPLPVQGPGLPWDEIKDGAVQCSSSREELLYLNFIEDITDEILKLGLFSNRFLERLFERHIKQNKHLLEEEKMHHLLHILKVNLGCTATENLGKLDGVDMLNLHDFEKIENSEEYKNEKDTTVQQERQEYQKALDMLLSIPKDEEEIFSSPDEFSLPIYKSKYREGVVDQQVNDETDLGPSVWDEKNPGISDSPTGQETSVTVIEGDSDTEKAESLDELCCDGPALSQSVQLCGVKGDNSHDMQEPTLKVMEMSIEDCPVDV